MPVLCFSTATVFNPCSAHASAAASPAGPRPHTTTSTSWVATMSDSAMCSATKAISPSPAAPTSISSTTGHTAFDGSVVCMVPFETACSAALSLVSFVLGAHPPRLASAARPVAAPAVPKNARRLSLRSVMMSSLLVKCAASLLRPVAMVSACASKRVIRNGRFL